MLCFIYRAERFNWAEGKATPHGEKRSPNGYRGQVSKYIINFDDCLLLLRKMCGVWTNVVVEQEWTRAINKSRLFDSEFVHHHLYFFTVHICSNCCARSEEAVMSNAGLSPTYKQLLSTQFSFGTWFGCLSCGQPVRRTFSIVIQDPLFMTSESDSNSLRLSDYSTS